jgi:hypothetical protein
VPVANRDRASTARGRSAAIAAGLHGQEQQQRQQEREVRRQTGDAAQQRTQHRRQPSEVQRPRRLSQLLRAHTQCRQPGRRRLHQAMRRRRVLRQFRRQPGHGDDDPQCQTQQDRVDQQDHHQGGRPPGPAMAYQPALHRAHRDHHDQRHERGPEQPRGGLDPGDDHDRRGRADEDHQGARHTDASEARTVRQRRRHRPRRRRVREQVWSCGEARGRSGRVAPPVAGERTDIEVGSRMTTPAALASSARTPRQPRPTRVMPDQQ